MKTIYISLFTILLILSGWYFTYSSLCFSLLFAFVILLIIALSHIEKAMTDRICFSNCYIQKKSFIATLLRSKVLTTIFYMLNSIILCYTLLYEIININYKHIPYLIIYFISIILLFILINYLLKSTIKKDKIALISREISINIANFILIALYAYIFYNSFEPTFLKDTLPKTIFYATNSIGSQCDYIDYMLRLHREVDSVFWFLIKQISDTLAQNILNYFIWVIFITINSFAIVGLNRFVLQITYIVYRLFDE